MKTSVALALAVFASMLTGCSGGDASSETPSAASAATMPTSAEQPPAPCMQSAPDAGVTASSFAVCQGQFATTTYLKSDPKNAGGAGTYWLHRTGDGCAVGNTFALLRADGTASGDADDVGETASGTWTGDEYYFRVELQTKAGIRVTEYARTEADPSK